MMKHSSLKFSVLLSVYSMSFLLLGLLMFSQVFSGMGEVELFVLGNVSFSFCFIFDSVSISFSMIVTLISSCVFFFANKYMTEDPFSTRFFWLLLAFVLSMNFLIFGGSVFLLLLGWDGLGITSFALIIYYESGESQMAGFQTLMINRIGDVIIVLSFFLFCSSGQLTLFCFSDNIFYGSTLISLLCLAALTKSAQFPFSSWLPAAMAAPTPVSALVHSSTLVTAGIYLIIRLMNSAHLSSSTCSMLLLCGSVTCLLGGWAATFENDIKKVIALSTLSQLGVMVFSLGMNFPSLSLFHLYTHALFKALLFLAAGHILMITFGSQDLRHMGGLGLSMPFTSLMFVVSSFCLIGAPFMSAFYSKHLILELMLMSSLNLMSVFIMLLATFMTAKYVFRTLKSVVWGSTGMSLISGVTDIYVFLPVTALGVGGIIGGEFYSSVEVQTLEFSFIPVEMGIFLNSITVLGALLGVSLGQSVKESKSLSSLFYLTPLVYGSPKVFSSLLSSVGVLDYGWMEPYFLIKNSVYMVASTLSQEYWPNSSLLVSLGSCLSMICIVSLFVY